MPQPKRATARKKKQPAKKNNDITLNIIGLIFLFVSLFAIFKLGYIGNLFANGFRFFVGDTYVIIALLVTLLGFYLLVTSHLPKLPRRIIIGGILLYLGGLIFYDAFTFHQLGVHDQFMNVAWEGLADDFRRNGVTNKIGGGLIGSGLYQLSYFLFAQAGTYVVSMLVMLGGCLLLANVPMSKVIQTFSNMVKGIFTQGKKVKHVTAKKVEQTREKLMTDEPIESVEPTVSPRKDVPMDLYPDSIPEPEPTTVQAATAEVLNSPKTEKKDLPKPHEEVATKGVEIPLFEYKDTGNYQLPPLSLLNDVPKVDQSAEEASLVSKSEKLQATFASFGVKVEVVDHNIGPTVTKYEIRPAVGVKVSKIVNLADDLALALAAKDVRIEAPIPGKSLVGIEVPNQQVSTVGFKDVIAEAKPAPDKPLQVPLGKDISGKVISSDLTKMPHLLIAGSTGSGKSVAINGIITSILMHATASEVKMMLIDPKMVELNVYNGIPHLLTPVVTESRKAASALGKVVTEMERRYQAFADLGQRNIAGFNHFVQENNKANGTEQEALPYLLVVIDELADLMMVASKEVEDCIIRIAQMGRAAGIHMIVATQRPSVDVITGLIKANVPSRVAFAVSSGIDSRTILDTSGAEKLLGRGDMLYLPMGANKPVRLQGAFISDSEVEKVVQFVANQQEADYDEAMLPTEPVTEEENGQASDDDLYNEAVAMVVREQKASASFLQRRFRIGYSRAARILDEMEQNGVVGPQDGSRGRKVYQEPNSEDELPEAPH